MPLNEADTRAQLIDPQINRSGWTRSQIRREHFYKTDWEYTAGKVVLCGDRAERAKPKRVDYLLRWPATKPGTTNYRWLDGVGERLFPLAPDVRAAWERHYNEDGPKPEGPYSAGWRR